MTYVTDDVWTEELDVVTYKVTEMSSPAKLPHNRLSLEDDTQVTDRGSGKVLHPWCLTLSRRRQIQRNRRSDKSIRIEKNTWGGQHHQQLQDDPLSTHSIVKLLFLTRTDQNFILMCHCFGTVGSRLTTCDRHDSHELYYRCRTWMGGLVSVRGDRDGKSSTTDEV